MVLKRYAYGYVVSFSEDVANAAYREGLPLILYVMSWDAFYAFEPEEVFREGRKNLFNRQVMLNVSIRLGTNLERLARRQI